MFIHYDPSKVVKDKKPAAAPKAVTEPKPHATKKRAVRKPLSEEVKVEITPEVVSPLKVEEPEIAEVSDDIKEILANSEV